jgi:type I restriction enzyme S subunit
MIGGLRPYPAMKDSGVAWLGGVPAHWQVSPALAVYRPRQVKNTGLIESTVLSLSYGRIIVKAPERLRGLVPESFETYQIVEPGNIIVRTTDLQNDQTSLRIGHARHRGIITAAYMCLETKPIVLNQFGYQYLNAYDLLKIIYGFGSGLRQNLDFSDIKRMPVLVPQRDEQAAIVRFLDHADRRIRRYIRAKQKLIKLLEEQKQAIIHRAVTRGLDANVRLKPSGVEWLGDVPAHWEVVKLSRWFRCTSGATPSRSAGEYFGGHIPWIRTGELVNSEIHGAAERITQKAFDAAGLTLLPIDTLLIAMYGQGQTRGRTGLLKIAATVNQAALAILPNAARAAPKYLQLWFMSQYWSLRHLSEARNATQPNLNSEIIKGLKVVLPPLIEQERIVKAVGIESTTAVAAIDRARREISLLHEYRTRLIADVVTGKLEVREAAARSPQEAEELEPLDETEALGEMEGESAADDLEPESQEADA